MTGIQCLIPLLAAVSVVQQPSYPPSLQDTLRLPRALERGETVELEVRLGDKSREEIVIRNTEGQLIGVVSPFGLHGKSAGSAYLIPLPTGTISDGVVVVRFSIEHDRQQPHAPDISQLKTVQLRIRRRGP